MSILKNTIKRSIAPWWYQRKTKQAAYQKLVQAAVQQKHNDPSAAAADLFTYHGEDGIIQNLVSRLQNVPPLFVDIGAGNCIVGNCATLAVHNKWKGVFIDDNAAQLSIGKKFYSHLQMLQQLQFVKKYVTPQNIDTLLQEEEITGEIGLLSIDIDGNDYWVWQAVTCIRPAIVVIEAKVEFGFKNIVVPYSASNHHSYHKQYNGASVEALRKLGVEKGYTLVASNPQGYNLFFVRNELLNQSLPERKTTAILQHPETTQSFYPETFFEQHSFIQP